LGKAHVIPSDLLQLLGIMDHMATIDFNVTCHGICPCAEIMCAIDTYAWSWADQQAHSAMPIDPRYILLAEEFQLCKWRLPTLPAQLLAVGPTRDWQHQWPWHHHQQQPVVRLSWWSTTTGNRACLTASLQSGSCYKWPHCPNWHAARYRAFTTTSMGVATWSVHTIPTTESTWWWKWLCWSSTWLNTVRQQRPWPRGPESAHAMCRRVQPCEEHRAWAPIIPLAH
jgi:hypothetical protein